jgi:enamine deaminase RidA (YjgF/YER057c/UK114 family)
MELAPGGLEAEAKQTMENIGAILRSNGLSFDDVFKCTVMIAHMAKWGAFNKIYVRTSNRIICLLAPLLAQMDWHWGHRSNWNAGLLLTNSDQPI